ncbi:MAG: O-antigen ligase family protein [Candidatus Shapirobacteria bacterium]|jgi:O-antigen ligase
MKLIPRAIIFCYLLLFFFTPLIFTSFNSELFELPKTYFVFAITILVLSLHLINHFVNATPLYRRSFLDIPFALFLLSQAISTIISIDPHTSLWGYYSRMNGGLLSTVSYLTLFWVFNVYLTDSLKNKLVHTALISGLIVSVYGILQHFGIDKHLWIQDVQNRVFSTLGQPNWLAAYLCILIPFAILKFLNSKSKLQFTVYSLLITVFYLCLLFTKSKSGILAAIITISLFLIIYSQKTKKILLPIIVSGLVIIFLFTVNNPIQNRLSPSSPQTPSALSEVTADTNITASEDIRKIVWQGAFDLWKRFPVLGTGVETFAYSYYWTRPTSHNLTSEWDFLYNKAHNEYLNYLATTGALGLLAYLLIIFTVLKKLIPNHQSDIENLAILSGFSAILITNAAGFTVVVSSLFFFLLPALIKIPPQVITPKAKLKDNFFTIPLVIFTLICGSYLFNTITAYYLADIAFAQSENTDADQEPQTAYDYIGAAIKFRPTEPLYQSKMSTIAVKLASIDKQSQDNNIKIALAASDKSVADSPANVNFWKERAQMFIYLSTIDSKYFTDSIESLLSASRLAPTDAKIFYLIGRFYLTAGQTPEALLYFQKAIDQKPNYDFAYFDMGKIYLDQKDYQKAKESFETTLKIAPKNTDAQNYLDQINLLD